MSSKRTVSKRSSKKKELSTPKRVLIIVGVVILSIIVIPIITSLISWSSLQAIMSSEVSNARSTQGQVINERRLEQISELVEKGATNSSTPLYSSLVDGCYIDHADRGWTIASYYQRCYMRYVDVFETGVSKDEYLSLVVPHKEYPSYSVGLLSFSVDSCSNNDPSFDIVDDARAGYLEASQNHNASLPCGIPEQQYGNRVVTYAKNDVVSDRNEIGALGQVLSNKNYVVLVGDYLYYKKDLGCKPLALFCEQPIGKPVIGNRE